MSHKQDLFNFFALEGSTDAPRVYGLGVTGGLQAELSSEFANQLEAFGFGTAETIPYEPQYQPDGDELLETPFQLPETIPDLAHTRNLEALPDEAIEGGTLRAILGVKQSHRPNPPVYCFQAVDSRQLLRRGRFTIVRSQEVFSRNDRNGVAIRESLSAVFCQGKLFFRNESAVRRFLDLSAIFAEATTPQVEAFFGNKAFAVDDIDGVVGLADNWMRRKITSILEQKILIKVTPDSIVRASKKFQMPVETKHDGGRQVLVVPSEKKALKNLLKLLDQDFFESPLTSDHFLTNSKRKLSK